MDLLVARRLTDTYPQAGRQLSVVVPDQAPPRDAFGQSLRTSSPPAAPKPDNGQGAFSCSEIARRYISDLRSHPRAAFLRLLCV